jgi:hypothetical protein
MGRTERAGCGWDCCHGRDQGHQALLLQQLLLHQRRRGTYTAPLTARLGAAVRWRACRLDHSLVRCDLVPGGCERPHIEFPAVAAAMASCAPAWSRVREDVPARQARERAFQCLLGCVRGLQVFVFAALGWQVRSRAEAAPTRDRPTRRRQRQRQRQRLGRRGGVKRPGGPQSYWRLLTGWPGPAASGNSCQ